MGDSVFAETNQTLEHGLRADDPMDVLSREVGTDRGRGTPSGEAASLL